jgi:hypothetical protein
VAAIAVPIVLLVTMLMVVFGLTSGLKCRPAPAAARTAARSSALVMPGRTGLAGCRTTGTAKTAAGGHP